MKTLIILLFNITFVQYVHSKCVYIDPETGVEIWQMTSSINDERMIYPASNSFSPDGKYLAVDVRRRGYPRIWLLNSNGSEYRPITTSRIYKWSSYAHEDGTWSHDGKRYFLNKNGYYVDVDSGVLKKVGNSDDMYWVRESPDGKVICGINKQNDHERKDAKFICIKNYLSKPVKWEIPLGSQNIDVTFGWFGSRKLWFTDKSGPVLHRVIDIYTKNLEGILNNKKSTGKGYYKYYHPVISKSATRAGDLGVGLIAGHTPGYYFSNIAFNHTNSIRRLRYIGEQQTVKQMLVDVPIGTHAKISPNEKQIVIENVFGELGKLAVYDLDQPKIVKWIARYRDKESYIEGDQDSWRPYPHPIWSPDGTKIAYWTRFNKLNEGDIFFAIYRKPSPPSNLSIMNKSGVNTLVFKSPVMKYEVKEYEVLHRPLNAQVWKSLGFLPNRWSFSSANSVIGKTDKQFILSDKLIDGERNQLEIEAFNGVSSGEFVTCDITLKHASNCIRGVNGTKDADHQPNSFVWLSTEKHGFHLKGKARGCYKVRSVEWSGLKGEWSDELCIK